MRLEFTIDIHRSPRDVFALVSDLENDPKWQSAVIKADKLSPGPIGEGSHFRHVVKLMGRLTDVDIEIVHHEPCSRYTLHCTCGPLIFDTEVRFERIAEGTRLITLVEGHVSGWLRVVAVALSHHRQAEIQSDLRNLKQLMESAAL